MAQPCECEHLECGIRGRVSQPARDLDVAPRFDMDMNMNNDVVGRENDKRPVSRWKRSHVEHGVSAWAHWPAGRPSVVRSVTTHLSNKVSPPHKHSFIDIPYPILSNSPLNINIVPPISFRQLCIQLLIVLNLFRVVRRCRKKAIFKDDCTANFVLYCTAYI